MQKIKAVVIALGFSLELDGKTQLLKTLYTVVIGHGEAGND